MKKTLSIVLALAMVFCLSVSVFADSTVFTFTGDADEFYDVTVPALLHPGESGDVSVEGTWPSNKVLEVGSDASVVLINSIKSSDTKTLDVTFAGISLQGDNNYAVDDTESIEIADISDALFGTWSGKISYTVELNEVEATEPEQTEQTEQPEQPEQTEQTEQPEQTPQTGGNTPSDGPRPSDGPIPSGDPEPRGYQGQNTY